ncbi:conserved hypothetical protein [Frankia canadensis]|uniref:Uncharacterized protein n=1 Tax=Frankia canadensis TaxID=1836972 RepID=A0A2I2L1W0_9ACTN|nr:conserved hypothetical protein [Frankia canadensis]SOU59192.1 conserved hypothetical protein [Frankia canadensis]
MVAGYEAFESELPDLSEIDLAHLQDHKNRRIRDAVVALRRASEAPLGAQSGFNSVIGAPPVTD